MGPGACHPPGRLPSTHSWPHPKECSTPLRASPVALVGEYAALEVSPEELRSYNSTPVPPSSIGMVSRGGPASAGQGGKPKVIGVQHIEAGQYQCQAAHRLEGASI